ncbi:MAG: phosphoribosylanthranilate isomerase [Oscillospiraceae bacterium]|nr:phosphoribosylanthranilate isomerase [Oscillospiraceae bacterium]
MSKVKICGLCSAEDICAVNRALPDYIGFVFAPSRRRVDIKTAAELKARIDARIKTVGVFVNETASLIESLYRSGVIDLAQLHGDEDEAYIAGLRERTDGKQGRADGREWMGKSVRSGGQKRPPLQIIKAVSVGDTMPPLPKNADYLLFDTLSPNRGGTGVSFDWDLLKSCAGLPYFLAGGLSAQNAAKAIKTLSPYCVDVSSGVETDGVKDAAKIEAFVRLVRNCI